VLPLLCDARRRATLPLPDIRFTFAGAVNPNERPAKMLTLGATVPFVVILPLE